MTGASWYLYRLSTRPDGMRLFKIVFCHIFNIFYHSHLVPSQRRTMANRQTEPEY